MPQLKTVTSRWQKSLKWIDRRSEPVHSQSSS